MDQFVGESSNRKVHEINNKFALSIDSLTKSRRVEYDLVDNARKYSDKIALVADSKHLTYKNLFAYAAHLSSELITCGLTRGERVTVYFDKTPEAVIACYAVWLAGGILVPAHESLRTRQLDYILQHSGSRLLLSKSRKLARFGIKLPDQVLFLDYNLPT